ncbi:MAG TPA: hypothetical protein VHL59_07575 [Thermoanaerobaculia bacterium]|nr:hypothetical protein [Thermoanaerobaculia bacterium]
MSFDDEARPYYEEVLKPAVEAAGVDCVRIDDVSRAGWIREAVWQSISEADVIIADLVWRSENVLYEIGLSHAACKPVVLIADTDRVTNVPFYLRDLNIILVERSDAQWQTKLQSHVTRQVADALKNPGAVLSCFRHGPVSIAESAPESDKAARDRFAQVRNLAEARQLASLAIRQWGMPQKDVRRMLEERFEPQEVSGILDRL